MGVQARAGAAKTGTLRPGSSGSTVYGATRGNPLTIFKINQTGSYYEDSLL